MLTLTIRNKRRKTRKKKEKKKIEFVGFLATTSVCQYECCFLSFACVCEHLRDILRFALVTFAHYYDRKRKKKMIMMIVKEKNGTLCCDMQQKKIIRFSLTSKETYQ